MREAALLTFVFLTGLGMAFTPRAHAEPNQYLCVAERAAGLHYTPQSNAWGPQAFRGETKYILRRLTDDDRKSAFGFVLRDNPKTNWVFLELGEKQATGLCVGNTSDPILGGMYCRPVLADVFFSNDINRFEIVRHGAYINQGYLERHRVEDPELYKSELSDGVNPSHPDDLVIEIGRCSPF
jgi:hypothetical protein